MATASLVISIFALLVAGFSTVYTRQQAQANNKLARIEHERYLEQQTPEFMAWVENLGGWQRLWLRLESTRTLSQIVATLVDAEDVSFTHSQNGVDPSTPAPIKTANWGTLNQADKACWRIEIGDNHPRDARLRILCHSDIDASEGTEWTVLVPFKLPSQGPFALK